MFKQVYKYKFHKAFLKIIKKLRKELQRLEARFIDQNSCPNIEKYIIEDKIKEILKNSIFGISLLKLITFKLKPEFLEIFENINFIDLEHFEHSLKKNLQSIINKDASSQNKCIFDFQMNNDEIINNKLIKKKTKRKSFVISLGKKLTGFFEKKVKQKKIEHKEETRQNNFIDNSFEDIQDNKDITISKFSDKDNEKGYAKLTLIISLAEISRYILELYSRSFSDYVCPFFLSKFKVKQFKKTCFEFYLEAISISNNLFPVLNSMSIKLELSFCIFVYEVLGDKITGRKKIKQLYMNSLKDLKRLTEDNYIETLYIIELVEKNYLAWNDNETEIID